MSLISSRKAELSSTLIEFQTMCNIVSTPVVVSIMKCKSLCFSVSNTNIVSTLAPSEQKVLSVNFSLDMTVVQITDMVYHGRNVYKYLV